MKKILLSLIITISTLTSIAQSNPYGDKYDDPSFDAIKIIKIIETADFSPVRVTKDAALFRSILLRLPSRAYTQLNIDSWYKCSFEHEQSFKIYNSYYKSVSQRFFDDNCKALVTFMLIDGTLKSKD